MNEFSAGLPAAGAVRVVGPEDAGTGFLVSGNGLIVTCAHVLAGSVPGDTVHVEPHAGSQPLAARVDLIQNPPDVALLQLITPVPPGVAVLPLGRTPGRPQDGLRTFGYPQVRPETGLPAVIAVTGITADAGYQQLALRSEEATLGFSGAPIWDPGLGAVVGMVKSIARGDPAQRLRSTAFGVPADVIRALCPDLRLPATCPYRGLEAFAEEHADCYFGREHAIRQLLGSLAARDFVPVVAVSGGGKSSLLQAGLAKGLRDGSAASLAQRARCYQRAGSQPHADLLRNLAHQGIVLPENLAQAPARELASAIRAAVAAACPAGLIVVIDQYERLHTDCGDEERRRFTELLLLLATGLVKVVIGLRADFYDLALADLGERLADGQVALVPMSEQDLTRAVTEPARKLLRSLEPGLARQIVTDVHDRPGDLPLLQFALTQLWERDAGGGVLTRETYEGLGTLLQDGERLPGAQGALVSRAEQLWQGLNSDDQRRRLQRILLGLIAVQPAGNSSASQAGSLRDLSRPALVAQWDANDQRLIQRLIDARLLTASMALGRSRAAVEVSHEVLLRAWPRLRDWLEERASFVQWRALDLSPNLERWLDSRERSEFLLPRPMIDPALRWLKEYPDGLAGPPTSYIQASKRRAGRRNRLIGGAVAVVVTASLTVAVIFAILQQSAFSAQQAVFRELAVADSSAMVIASLNQGSTDPHLSASLSVAAGTLHKSEDATYAMLAAAARPQIGYIAPGSRVVSMVLSPDGKTLTTVTTDDLTATSENDGKGAHIENVVQQWNVATRKLIRSIILKGGSLGYSPTLSPNGSFLATKNDSGYVQVWNVATGKPIGSITLDKGDVIASVSPDGTTLASITIEDGSVRLWNVAARQQINRTITNDAGRVTSAAFSTNDTMLATASEADDGADATVQLWSLSKQSKTGVVINVDGYSDVNTMAFGPDDNTLATGAETVAQAWNVKTGQQTGSTVIGGGSVTSVALSQDGKTLADVGGSGDGVELLDNRQQVGSTIVIPLSSESNESTALSQDGKTLATVSRGTAQLWDTANLQPIRSIPIPSGNPVTSMALTPDGQELAALSADGKVRLWNTATGKPMGSVISIGGPALTGSITFEDGKTLATISGNGTARLWDTATGKPIRTIPITPPNGSSVVSTAFGQSGKTLVTIRNDGTARLWDTATGKLISTLAGAQATSRAVALSPDGKTLATSGNGGPVHLWDVATGQLIGTIVVPESGGAVSSLLFSLDGTTLTTVSDEDGTIRHWDVSYLTDPASELCASAASSLTQAEWKLYAPGLKYQSTCNGKA